MKLKETVNGGNIMMTVDVSSSSSDGVGRLIMFVVICVTGRGRMEEHWVSAVLCSVQVISVVDIV